MRCVIIVLREHVLIVLFAVEPPESLAWLSDFGCIQCPDVKLHFAVDRKRAENIWREMCQ